MPKILLTGASGFLGRHILHELLQRGQKVKAVVRHTHRYTFPCGTDLEVIKIDDVFAASADDYRELVFGADMLIHAAWYTNPKDYRDSESNLKCLCGSVRLAQAFCESGGKHFVGIGTCFEYDTQYGYLRPETPLRPTTLYGKTKTALSSVLEHYCRLRDCSFMWMRVFNLYGRAPDSGEYMSRLVPYLHEQLARGEPATLTHGAQIRDYLEVHDAASRIATIALSGNTGFANICSGVAMTVQTLAEQIADMYGRQDLLQFCPLPHTYSEPPLIIGEPYTVR